MPEKTPRTAMDSLGTLFRDSWKIFTGKFWTLVGVFAVPAVILAFGQMLLILSGGGHGQPPSNFGLAGIGGLLVIIGGITAIISSIALIEVAGRKADFGTAYRKGFQLFWPMVWIAIIQSFALLGGFILLIVPGIILAISFFATRYALVLEDMHGMSALVTSREYVRGYWWSVLGRMILFGLIMMAIFIFIYAPFVALVPGPISSTVYGIIMILAAAYGVCYLLVIYENLKRLKPEVPGLVAAHKEKGSNAFVKVCMVAGIAVAVLFLTLFIVFGKSWIQTIRDQGNYGNNGTGTLPGGSAMPMEGISPSSGPVGTEVMIMFPQGSAKDTFTVLMDSLVAAKDLSYTSGDMIQFAVPANLSPNCRPGMMCPQFMMHLAPGTFSVSVLVNDTGTPIPVGTFTVTAAGSAPGSAGSASAGGNLQGVY